MLNMHLNTLSPPEVEGSPLIGVLRIFVPKSPFASKQSILIKNIFAKFRSSSIQCSSKPPARARSSGGCWGWLQQAQGVAVITGIPEQRMQINTLMNFYLQQFDTLAEDTRKHNCDEKRNRKQYRVRKFYMSKLSSW